MLLIDRVLPLNLKIKEFIPRIQCSWIPFGTSCRLKMVLADLVSDTPLDIRIVCFVNLGLWWANKQHGKQKPPSQALEYRSHLNSFSHACLK